MTTYPESIGMRIRRARLQQSLTQAEVAERLACTEGYIAHLEGGRSLPSEVKLLQLCDVLKLDKREMIHMRQRQKASRAARPYYDDIPPVQSEYFRDGESMTSEQLRYARRVIRAVEKNRKFKAILDVMLEEEERQ